MLTYKFHALGDYVATIKIFGTTDSYSTQIGELSHCLIKKFYRLSSKRDVSKQLARQERWLTHVRHQQQANDLSEFDTSEVSEMDSIPELHHVLTHSPNNVIDLRMLLRDLRAQGDPAIKDDFVSRLKDHILARLYQNDYDGDEHQFTNKQHSQLHFTNNLNRVIESRSFHVNFTSYDIRRQQDFMRPGHESCTVMTLSREDKPDPHPFWYAQVLHAFIISFVHIALDARNRSPQTMEVLWVRWLGIVPRHTWGFKAARLPKVGFVPEQDNDAFGFLDPSFVIRRCHLIPMFSEGRTDRLLKPGKSIARQPGDVDEWSEFYVNIFADRDMFARFAGIGVGHMAQYHRGDMGSQTLDDSNDSDLNVDTNDSDSDGHGDDGSVTPIRADEDEQDGDEEKEPSEEVWSNSDSDIDGSGDIDEHSDSDGDFEF